jgi:hypothetical protein
MLFRSRAPPLHPAPPSSACCHRDRGGSAESSVPTSENPAPRRVACAPERAARLASGQSCSLSMAEIRASQQATLTVAQSAGGFLQIRFQVIECHAILGMALARDLRQPCSRAPGFAHHQLRNNLVVQPAEQIVVAREIAAVEKRNRELSIVGVVTVALARGCATRDSASTAGPTIPARSGERDP